VLIIHILLYPRRNAQTKPTDTITYTQQAVQNKRIARRGSCKPIRAARIETQALLTRPRDDGTRHVGGRGLFLGSVCGGEGSHSAEGLRHTDLMVSVRPGPCKLSLASPTTVMAVVAVTAKRRAFCTPAVFPSAPSNNGE